MTTSSTDYTICFDPEKPTFSCKRAFAYKDYEGLCARSLHLSALVDPEEVKRDAAAPVCEGCGAIVMFMPAGVKLCGAFNSHTKDPPATELLSSSRDLQTQKQLARSSAMAHRILPTGKAAASTNTSSTTAHSAGAYGGRIIKLYLAPISPRGTEVWKKIGVASGNFPENDLFRECMNEMLAHWNLVWDKKSTESLTLEHIDTRFYGNITPRPGSELQTIGYFHDANDSNLPGDKNKRCPTVTRPPKSPFIYLEGYINVDDFEESTGTQAPDWMKNPKDLQKKRKLATLVTTLSSQQKKSSVPALLKSTWIPQVPSGSTKIDLLFAKNSFDDQRQADLIAYPEIDNTIPGYLCDEEFDIGATKKVYKIIIDGKEWAAKRFWNIGNGDELVSVMENHSEIENEAIQLCQLCRLLAAFIDQAKKKSDESFYSPGKEGVPSPASRVSDIVYSGIDSQKKFITWLLEPMRPRASVTTKWSGTMQHPLHNSKLGDTLMTFVHFAYHWTYKTLVFADLQTTRVETVVGGSGDHILFDVMTHTLAGQSGVGDHGLEGIQKFCDMHECRNKCKNLGLGLLKTAAFEENNEPSTDEESGEDSGTEQEQQSLQIQIFRY
ncbi:kinase-like domain-containing protein [Lentinula edodes]|nr:kinase-like domain-containing protein [Lentinula edodes]